MLIQAQGVEERITLQQQFGLTIRRLACANTEAQYLPLAFSLIRGSEEAFKLLTAPPITAPRVLAVYLPVARVPDVALTNIVAPIGQRDAIHESMPVERVFVGAIEPIHRDKNMLGMKGRQQQTGKCLISRDN
jgi:hypothetical protein